MAISHSLSMPKTPFSAWKLLKPSLPALVHDNYLCYFENISFKRVVSGLEIISCIALSYKIALLQIWIINCSVISFCDHICPFISNDAIPVIFINEETKDMDIKCSVVIQLGTMCLLGCYLCLSKPCGKLAGRTEMQDSTQRMLWDMYLCVCVYVCLCVCADKLAGETRWGWSPKTFLCCLTKYLTKVTTDITAPSWAWAFYL
jgi:hypothetical protein